MNLRRVTASVSVVSLAAAVALAFGTTAAAAPVQSTGVHASEMLVRSHVVNGQTKVVDRRSFSLSVNTTAGLRNRQEVKVSWRGAHPTGGIATDPNSADAQFEEYPVVLLECRGTAKTVSPATCWTQTARERFERSSFAFPSWRMDRYATTPQRAAVVGAPKKRSSDCGPPSAAEYWVPFVASNGATYGGGPGLLGCAGLAPEASNGDTQLVPSNETFGVTGTDGTGQAAFDIWTAEQNASLGCSDKLACSLVAVPIIGISCDEQAKQVPAGDRPTGDDLTQADRICTASGQYKPGDLASQSVVPDLAVSGSLWWAASNWRNRVVVPLNFAPLSNVCDVVKAGNKPTLEIYGSELMTQATTQWKPAFCLKRSFAFQHVQTGEPQAANLLKTGTIEAAFVSNPPDGGYGKPVVSAPVAVSGFSIAADVDGANNKPASSVRLTPRLIAKLLTESYPAVSAMQQEDPDVENNPINITYDPEFKALNPSIPESGAVTAATLLGLSSDSDVISALTAYINADPEARAWLDGKPDPWGMVVNPAYKGISLPVKNWPLLDTFEPKGIYQPGINDCLYDDPVPYLPLIAAPMLRLSLTAQAMQFAIGNSQIVCVRPNNGVSDGEKLTSVGRETPGHRFMLGLTTLADAQRYDLVSASLQTHVSGATGGQFTDASGRTFVAPTNDSLAALGQATSPNKSTGLWPIDYSALRTTSAGAKVYPGTMVVYLAAPTTGLPAADATNLAQLLSFIGTAGQTPGHGSGQLPPGYVPLTKTTGFAALAGYTVRAAAAIAGQHSLQPSAVWALKPFSPASTSAPTGSPTTGSSGGQSSQQTGGSAPPSTTSAPPSVTVPKTPSATTQPPAAPTVAQTVALGITPSVESGIAGNLLPLLLLLAIVSAAISLLSNSARKLRRRT